ncbi:MAG: hypothetical protein Q7R47_06605, partial [Candidatus Diapherotrites archaeon]|nr:hypothetical protein [Candidatus Diapherotrites archaeon]
GGDMWSTDISLRQRLILGFGILLLLVLALASSALADGMIVRPDMMPVYQSRQEAFVVHENGTEKLVMMVNLADTLATGERAVWIFPVPAKPEDIKINNLKGFPVLAGKDVKRQFTDNMGGLEAYMAVAAFPPAGLLFFLIGSVGTVQYQMADALTSAGYATDRITIYQHIDKFGVATEVVKADTEQRLESYLRARGTNLSPDAKELLDEYMGKDYSFVVSWISDANAAQQAVNPNAAPGGYYPDYGYPYYGNQNPIGVFISFPSDDIYFPLKPTAYYGDRMLPVTVNVLGFKSPSIYQNIRDRTTVSHRFLPTLSRTIDEQKSLEAIFGENIPDSLAYTTIAINTSAKYFTEDIRFADTESAIPHVTNFLNQTWIVWLALLFFGLGIAAMALTKRLLNLNLSTQGLALIALANFLTVIVAAVVIALLKKERFGVKENESGWMKKAQTLVVFEAVFLGFAVLLFVISIGLGALK